MIDITTVTASETPTEEVEVRDVDRAHVIATSHDLTTITDDHAIVRIIAHGVTLQVDHIADQRRGSVRPLAAASGPARTTTGT